MTSPHEQPPTHEDIGKRLYDVAKEMLDAGHGVRADVVSGNPAGEGNHFSDHYVILPLWDEQTRTTTESIVITHLGEWNRETPDRIEVNPDGSFETRKPKRTPTGGFRSTRYPTGDTTLGMTLSRLTEGRVVDPDREVVMDEPEWRKWDRDGKPNIRRVYKKRSIRFAGRRILDKLNDSGL